MEMMVFRELTESDQHFGLCSSISCFIVLSPISALVWEAGEHFGDLVMDRNAMFLQFFR